MYLPIDCPELVVHFDVVRVGNIHSQRVTFIEVEARELRKKFVLPNSFIGGCRTCVRAMISASAKPTKSSSFSWALRF